jgi:hypothetical protein
VDIPVKIKFKGNVTLDVFYGESERDFETTDFFAGEVHEVTFLEDGSRKVIDIEFGNVTIAFNVPVKLFDIVKKGEVNE